MLEYSAASSSENSGSLKVFDVSNYYTLYQQTQNPEVVYRALVNDGLGLITEKIPGEKTFGSFVFNPSERIRMQMTPAIHTYYQIKDLQTGEYKMVPPELVDLERDILDVLSDWREGIDKRALQAVRSTFFEAGVDEVTLWVSNKAQAHESDQVRRLNGQYGWLYRGQVRELGIEDAEVIGKLGERVLRKMVVYDFKFAGDPEVAYQFLHKAASEITYGSVKTGDRFNEEVMTTVAKGLKELDWSSNSVWEMLSGVQKEVLGDGRIFNLPVNTLLDLQDYALKEKLKIEVSQKMADWLLREIQKGTSPDQVQKQVKDAYISYTREFMNQYTQINQPDLSVYSGSNGDGCGDWLDNDSDLGKEITIMTENGPIKTREYFRCPKEHGGCGGKIKTGSKRSTCPHCGLDKLKIKNACA